MRGVDVVGKCHNDIVGKPRLKLKREIDEEFGQRRDMMANVWGPQHAPRVPQAARARAPREGDVVGPHPVAGLSSRRHVSPASGQHRADRWLFHFYEWA